MIAEYGLDFSQGDFILGRGGDKAANRVFQLAHVAGPAVIARQIDSAGRKATQRSAIAFGAQQKMLGQKRDVVDPFAQRRHGDRHTTNPIEQILAKRALLHPRRQIDLRGGHDAGRMITEGIQHPHNPRLRVIRQIGDFVKHQCAALGAGQQRGRAIHPL